MRKGERTRERILELAESAVLQKGFAGTSIDELIAAAGITKGGFFYHFKDKSDLARHLLERYIANDDIFFAGLFRRADELDDDPLHAFLIFLKLFAEAMEQLPSTHPGCLVAAYCYQDQQFDDSIRRLNAEAVLSWRAMFRDRLQRIADTHPPDADVDLDDLADMASTLMEGALVLTKVLKDPGVPPRQILLYRDYLRRIFA